MANLLIKCSVLSVVEKERMMMMCVHSFGESQVAVFLNVDWSNIESVLLAD